MPLLLALLACGQPQASVDTADLESAPLCLDTAPPSLTLGEGRSAFDPLLPGDEPLLEYGPQGGTHIVIAADIESADLDAIPFVLSLEAELFNDACPEGCSIGGVTFSLTPDLAIAADDRGLTFGGLLLVVSGWSVADHRQIHASLVDACGRTDEVTLDLFPPPEESP